MEIEPNPAKKIQINQTEIAFLIQYISSDLLPKKYRFLCSERIIHNWKKLTEEKKENRC